MAHFTDQFTRHDPWTFRPSILIPTWPTILLQDARALALLSGVDRDALAEIAEEIEKELQAISAPYLFPVNSDHWIWTRVRQGWVCSSKAADTSSPSFFIRHSVAQSECGRVSCAQKAIAKNHRMEN